MTADNLSPMIERLKAGKRDEADIQAIAAAIASGKLVLSNAPGSVSIGENVSGSQVVAGNGNVMGDRNIVIYGADAETIQSILNQHSGTGHITSSISVDELVQRVRSRLHDDIQRLHGTMPLWGVDHWVPLGELFVDVNILEEVSSNRRSELADLWQDFNQNPGYRSLDRIGLGEKRQRVSGLEVLAKDTNLVVVGKPGSGKTTYLQRVVTECNAGNLQAHRIPVLLRLREFVEDGREVAYAVERYLERVWRLSEAETKLVLNEGRSLVLLDGLDEVTGEDGKIITKRIKQFARAYPKVQLVVTCRTQSQESRFERFDYVEVADFNEPQVRAFAEHWFQTVGADHSTGQAKAKAFLDQLFREEHKPIRELAITPILLSLTCAVFHQTGKFYSKRSKLYEEGLELLLEQWDKSREIERDEIYRDLSLERKLELLSYLAVKKFEQEQYVLFEQAEIEGYIAEFLGIGLRESRGVLRAIESQHGLLIKRAQKVWSFSHLTFQEYLVACEFLRIRNLRIDSSSKLAALVSHITETHWREVFLLVCDISEDAKSLIEAMRKRISELGIIHQNTQTLLELSHQKFPDIEVLLKLPEFEEASIEEATHWLSVARAICFEVAIGFAHDIYLALSILEDGNKVDLESALHLGVNYEFDKNYKLAVSIESSIGRAPMHELDRFGQLPLANQLDKILKSVKRPMLNAGFNTNSFEDLKQLISWWDLNGEKWNAQFEEFIYTHELALKNLKFSQEDLSHLRQYYYANKLLMDCIKGGSIISEIFVQEVRESLLLPIAEIEKRKREKME